MNETEAKQEDEVFKRKYRKLNPSYLDNGDAHANLDDVKNKLVTIEESDCIINYSGNVRSCVHYVHKPIHLIPIRQFTKMHTNKTLQQIHFR